jgi:ribosomal-protein-alanine N-acetyltransferase
MSGEVGGRWSVPPVIWTARLALRPMTAADADFVIELLNDEAFLRYVGDKGVRTREDARR